MSSVFLPTVQESLSFLGGTPIRDRERDRGQERVRRKDTHGDRERDRGQETENRERAWATSDHIKLGHWLSTKSVAVSAKGNRIALLFMMSSFHRLVAGTFLAPLAVAFKLSLVMW